MDAVRIDDKERICARLGHRAEELGHLVARHAVEESPRRRIEVQRLSYTDAEIVPVDDAVRLCGDRRTIPDIREIPLTDGDIALLDRPARRHGECRAGKCERDERRE